jgi:hypothetical protein
MTGLFLTPQGKIIDSPVAHGIHKGREPHFSPKDDPFQNISNWLITMKANANVVNAKPALMTVFVYEELGQHSLSKRCCSAAAK